MEVARLGGLTAVALQDLPQWGKVVVEMNGGRDPETCPLHLAPMFLS